MASWSCTIYCWGADLQLTVAFGRILVLAKRLAWEVLTQVWYISKCRDNRLFRLVAVEIFGLSAPPQTAFVPARNEKVFTGAAACRHTEIPGNVTSREVYPAHIVSKGVSAVWFFVEASAYSAFVAVLVHTRFTEGFISFDCNSFDKQRFCHSFYISVFS